MIPVPLLNENRKALQERLAELRKEIHTELINSDNQQFIELAGKVHDLEEESVADLLVDLNLADIDRHINEIRDIEMALSRINDGSYGMCLDCNELIETDRLRAYPTSKRCYACQAQYEKTHIQPGHHSL
jgi:RNA polymerase-binding transcription factor DksA